MVMAAMIQDQHDTCQCGDYRRDHANGGSCIFTSHGIPRSDAEWNHLNRCSKFRLMRAARDGYDDPCEKCVSEGIDDLP